MFSIDFREIDQSYETRKREMETAIKKFDKALRIREYFNSDESRRDIDAIAKAINDHLGIEFDRMYMRPYKPDSLHVRITIKDFNRDTYNNRDHIFPLGYALNELGFDAYVHTKGITVYNRKN